MILSRFWYLALALAAGALAYVLFLATGMHNRAIVRATGEALAGDSQVVASTLRDDARRRSSALLPIALDEDLRASLVKANGSPDKLSPEVREKARAALRKDAAQVPQELAFDALFAVDQAGRVVAQVGFDQASGIDGFELGGYPLVADALHGWVRDDAWIFGKTIYRVVARPVEVDAASPPAGAIIGARIANDSFARDLSRRTGAAVAFFVGGTRVASGAPEGFDISQLDTIGDDLAAVKSDPTYDEKGTSDVRMPTSSLGVVYAKLPGETWDLGAGYVVGRHARLLASPKSFLDQSDDKDKQAVPTAAIAGLAIAAGLFGILLTILEHTRPLLAFRREAAQLASGESDQIIAARLRGPYRRIATLLNDGIDKIAAKGGAGRKPADLQQVLGPIPAQPAMSAFSIGKEGDASARPPSAPGGLFATPTPPGPPEPPTPPTPPTPPAPRPPSHPSQPESSTLPAVLAVGVAKPAPPSGSGPAAAPATPATAAPPAKSPPKPPPPRPARPASAPAIERHSFAPSSSRTPVADVVPPSAASRTPATVVAPVEAVTAKTTPASSSKQVAAKGTFDEDESTVVSQAPLELLQRAGLEGEARGEDELAEWKRVFDDFVRTKKECGEAVEALTFERFQGTLRKNKESLVQKHGCKRVKFSVYVKDGRAALKASPVKD